jgi:creatinine amidohydrolase
MEHSKGDIHGGEKETSLMLHLCAEHVLEPVPQADAVNVPQDYMDYFDVADLTEDGYWGYPEAATEEKGEKLLKLMVECAIDFLRHLEATHESVRLKRTSKD